MPFGLANATATFQRLMDCILDGMSGFCSAYNDDILVYSQDWKSHIAHLDQVFSKLDGAGLTVKRSKCEWGKSGLIYLGHRIGDGRMAVPGDRASAVENFIRPTTKKGVRAFLGGISWESCGTTDENDYEVGA